MQRAKFQLYADYYTKLGSLSTEELGELFKAILMDRNGLPVSLSNPALRMAWAFVKDDLNAFDSMYEDTVRKQKKAAMKRWHPDADACK